jgi:hypothetical protein
MFEGLKRLYRRVSATLAEDTAGFDIDHPHPQRANPDPPRDDWFARVRERSLRSAATREAKALDALDARTDEPRLSRDASREVDALLAKATKRA